MYIKYNKKTWVYFTADPGKNKKLNYEKKIQQSIYDLF